MWHPRPILKSVLDLRVSIIWFLKFPMLVKLYLSSQLRAPWLACGYNLPECLLNICMLCYVQMRDEIQLCDISHI